MTKSTFACSLLVLTSLLMREPASAQQPGTLRWKIPLDSPGFYPDYLCSPAIGPDGTVYVSNGYEGWAAQDRGLFAISPQGTTNWIFRAGGSLSSSPAVGPDGRIYIGSLDQNLYCISPSGATNWVFHTPGWIVSSPALGADGTIYFTALTNAFNQLYAVNPDGTAKWVFSMLPVPAISPYSSSDESSSPAIGPDGTIYVGSIDTNLYAIKPDGTAQWTRSLGNRVHSSPSLGADGTIYIGSDNGWYAFAPDGTERWSVLPSNGVDASAAVGSDGTVYVATTYLTYALTPQGTQLWTAPGASASPALAADGTCYCVDRNSLYAINSSGSTLWKQSLLGSAPSGWVFSSPAIGADGTVYIAAKGYLWAFYGSSPPQQGPWAMFRREPTHNARAIQRGLSAPVRQSDGNFALHLGLDFGRTYQVQASSDLATWTVLTNFTSTSSALNFVDQSATNYPQRFYRLAVP